MSKSKEVLINNLIKHLNENYSEEFEDHIVFVSVYIDQLEQKVNQLELDVDSFENKYKRANELYLDTSKKLTQLETNWNEFKNWVEATIENNKYSYLSENVEDRYIYDVFKEVLDKMQELERGKE